ncbi:APLF-like protein [Mya arenaria]|uniref:APLF-like protein n=1 Tax=Mya arenaria TaxID=6604 RepID=A0ABY7DA78_MYAAR|nr:APLF-like protein [Mya arenaria]
MAIVKGKKKATDIPECPYGARCYRKNPQHFIDFFHPKKAKTSDTESNSDSGTDATDGPSTSSVSKLPTTDDSSLPPCKYGAKCYRKNLMHFAEFSHPTTVVASVQKSDSGSDTDEISDEDDKDSAKKDVKTSDILKRGMSLVKSYSQMTEAERKELIKKAFEAKQKLQEELAETKAEVKKKDEELSNLQKQVTTGFLLMEGEKEALEGSDVKYFELFPERSYKEGSAAQMHFRLAESQFYRLLSGSSIKLTKVEYVVNPDLVEHFKLCRENLKKTRGEDCSYPVLAFHGTTEQNIPLICKDGFKIPGIPVHKANPWSLTNEGTRLPCVSMQEGARHFQQVPHPSPAVPDKKAGLAKKIASAAAVGVGKVKAALTGKGTKKKGGKLSIDDLTDSALMANKHAKAMNMPASKCLLLEKCSCTTASSTRRNWMN